MFGGSEVVFIYFSSFHRHWVQFFMQFFIVQPLINGNYPFITSNRTEALLQFSFFNWYFLLVFPTRLFHRTDTYVGYYAGLLENIPIVAIYNLYFFIFVLFFIELCLYVEALIDDLKFIINIEMNSFVNSQIKFDSRKWRQFNSKFHANLKDFVLLHNDFCEYVHDVACFVLFLRFFRVLHFCKKLSPNRPIWF